MVRDILKLNQKLFRKLFHRVNEKALEKEFKSQKVAFEKQVKLELYYDNQKLKKYYRADFICYDSILLEIKAVNPMPNAFIAQLNNYLNAQIKN